MDLKPCPFCGSNKWHIKRAYQVECDVCGAEGPTAESSSAAIQAWNRRALHPEQRTCETCGDSGVIHCLECKKTPRAPQSADVEMVIEALDQLDCTCGAEGDDSDHSYEICNCYKHDALAALDRIVGKEK